MADPVHAMGESGMQQVPHGCFLAMGSDIYKFSRGLAVRIQLTFLEGYNLL